MAQNFPIINLFSIISTFSVFSIFSIYWKSNIIPACYSTKNMLILETNKPNPRERTMTPSPSPQVDPSDPTGAETPADLADKAPLSGKAKLQDVARAAGVSVGTASKALNRKTGVSKRNRTAVLKAAIQLGYAVEEEAYSPKALSNVTLLSYGRMLGNDAFYGDIVDGIVEEASREGLSVEICILDESQPDQSFQSLSTFPKSAIIMGADVPGVVQMLGSKNVATVLVNGIDPQMQVSSVSPDYYYGGWLATKHLLDLGHRDIVHITHAYRESITQRESGFRDALETVDITFDFDQHILDLGSPDMISVAASSIIRDFIKARKTPPTAFFCMSDVVALGAVQAIKECGLSVPDDISVVGFDGLAVGAHSIPPIASINIDRKQVGVAAVKTLLERGAFPTSPAKRIGIGVELVDRRSCAAPRKS